MHSQLLGTMSDYSSLDPNPNRKEALLTKFAMGEPVYFNRKPAPTLLVRKPNEMRVRDALEGARKRFEEQLIERGVRDKKIEE